MRPVRVLLVDDAVVVRHILKDTLGKNANIEVVDAASDGAKAVEMFQNGLEVEVVVLDVEMPHMDGIETLAAIKKLRPSVKVIMFSTLTSRGAEATMDALMMGADDYVTKPSNVGSMTGAIEAINAELIPRILHLTAGPTATSGIRPSPVQREHAGAATKPKVLAIAVSTGGPNALVELIPQLPADLGVPVLIVQHIPPIFSKTLADRLNLKSPLHVEECQAGAVLKPGDVWIAPGDFHMTVHRAGADVVLGTNQNPPENSCRPAADVLFRSVTEVYGAAALGLVMTGMGSDGLAGSQLMAQAGAKVIVQDEASSVVWGMAGSVYNAGLADAAVALQDLPDEVVTRLKGTQPSNVTAARQ